MMKRMRNIGLLALLAALTVSVAAAAEIKGHYLETRNAEIYASHCFANSELGLRGDLAMMAWKIDQGSFEGVNLDGLGVVAVIRASSTLGDPFNNPLPAKAALIFDEKADARQREALERFVQRAAGELAESVVHRDAAPIALDFHGNLHARRATLTAGNLVKVETRAIQSSDSLCHLDDLYYAPLTKLDHAMPAFAVEATFRGEGLETNYSDYNRSSVYLGSFTLAHGQLSD